MEVSTTNPLHEVFDNTPEQRELLERMGIVQEIVEKTTNAERGEQVLIVAGAVEKAIGRNPSAPVETLVDDALRILGVGQ